MNKLRKIIPFTAPFTSYKRFQTPIGCHFQVLIKILLNKLRTCTYCYCFVVLAEIVDMKKILLPLLCVACLLCTASSTYAQKYAYVNLGNLLTKMPQVSKGSADLEAYQKVISDELQAKVNAWEKRVEDVSSKVNSLPPNEIKKLEEQLLKEQEALYLEEQQLSAKMIEKRKEIMGPILATVQTAIDAVGKENGYTMIFDSSVPGTMLFVDDAVDLSTEVLAKLGIEVIIDDSDPKK